LVSHSPKASFFGIDKGELSIDQSAIFIIQPAVIIAYIFCHIHVSC